MISSGVSKRGNGYRIPLCEPVMRRTKIPDAVAINTANAAVRRFGNWGISTEPTHAAPSCSSSDMKAVRMSIAKRRSVVQHGLAKLRSVLIQATVPVAVIKDDCFTAARCRELSQGFLKELALTLPRSKNVPGESRILNALIAYHSSPLWVFFS